MRKSFAVVLMMAMAVAAIPARLFAAVRAGARQQQTGTLNGVATDANKQALSQYTVQVRNATTGKMAGTTVSSEAGKFSFAGLSADSYVIEIVDATGNVVGLSPAVAVGAGATVTVSVTASAAGAIAAAAGSSGFSLLGLGQLASIAVVAGAATTTAIVAVKANASPKE